MTNGAATPRGNIYDLGYHHYEGARLGRGYAYGALFRHSFRAVFGLGRPISSKAFPIGFAVIALIPAAIQLGVAALAPADVEIFRPEDYFNVIQIVLALFCAAVAPELIGRDHRSSTLPLYFSRALSRVDYVSAKLAAMLAALLLVILAPQTIMFIGNSVTTSDSLQYLRDNASDVPAILADAVIVAVYMGGVSLALASLTSRRAIATAIVLATFVFLTILGSILVETATGKARDVLILVSPLDVLDGTTRWLFGAPPPEDSDLAKVATEGYVYFLASVAISAAAIGFLYRRYLKLSV